MTFIKTIDIDKAEGIVKQEYEKGFRRSGRVFNILKIMSRSPAALKDAMRLYLTIMFGPSEISRAQREMIATVVSRVNHCHYWTEAHGNDFRDEVQNDQLTEHIKHDWREADLTKIDIALCTWAEKLTRTPGDMSQKDVLELENIGMSQEAISDATQVVGYFNYINRIADGLGVDLEPEIEP